MSADVYSDLTIGLGMKNYSKLTPPILESIHWIKSYWEISVLSADLYSFDLTIEKDLQNYAKKNLHMSKSIQLEGQVPLIKKKNH